MGMPPVQKTALAMLPKLAPTHMPQVRVLLGVSVTFTLGMGLRVAGYAA